MPKLTVRERKAFRLLLENSRMSDIAVAGQLGISSQAAGNIRRKLERNAIRAYGAVPDYGILGIGTFAIAISRLTSAGLECGDRTVDKAVLECPHAIRAYRLPGGRASHVILYGFADTGELDCFFKSPFWHKRLHRLLENAELFVFSASGLLKDDPSHLAALMLEGQAFGCVQHALRHGSFMRSRALEQTGGVS